MQWWEINIPSLRLSRRLADQTVPISPPPLRVRTEVNLTLNPILFRCVCAWYSRFRWWVYIGAEQRRSASASGRSWSGNETAPGLGTNHLPGSAPLHLPLMATVWAHKLSGWSVVSVVHLGVCDGHPQLVGPLAPPHAGRGVRSNTYTPLLPSFPHRKQWPP